MTLVDLAVREKEKKTLDDRLNKCRYALAKAQGKTYTPWAPSFFWWAPASKDELLDDLPPAPAAGGSRKSRRVKRSRRKSRRSKKTLRSK